MERTAERVEAVGSSKVFVRSCDINSETAVNALYEDVGRHFDKVDVLINSAGALNLGLIGEIEPALWWENFVGVFSHTDLLIWSLTQVKETNVRCPYLMVHHWIKHFGDAGTVITISSVASTAVHPGMSSYAAAKLAVNRVDECLQVGKADSFPSRSRRCD